jgi:hypothetical protein
VDVARRAAVSGGSKYCYVRTEEGVCAVLEFRDVPNSIVMCTVLTCCAFHDWNGWKDLLRLGDHPSVLGRSLARGLKWRG